MGLVCCYGTLQGIRMTRVVEGTTTGTRGEEPRVAARVARVGSG